jgi:hypothetical protein
MFLDSSTNNFLITRNGNTTQGTFSPYAENWSNYFDGNGDYLTVPNNAALQMDSGNFTIEFWINFSSIASYQTPYDKGYTNAGGLLFQTGNGNGRMVIYAAGIAVITESGTAPTSTWIHYALVRNGSTLTLYRDGTSSGSTTNSTNFNNSSQLGIGANGVAPAGGSIGMYAINGYLSNVRVVKGTAVYTSNFTPSTTPLLPIANTSLLTCRDNSFVDDSANRFAITRNGDVRVQRFGPFAGTTLPTPYYGAYFDGNGDGLTTPTNAAFTYGTGDFCIEGWYYFTGGVGGSGYSYLFAQGASTGNASLGLYIQDGVYKVWNGSAVITGSASFVQGTWVHLAVTRSGTNMRLFANGVQSGSATNSSNITTGSTLGISIGRWAEIGDTNYITGYVSNFRVVKGSAVYTSNFTPSTTPLTAVAGTSLLTCQSATFIDNSTNNFAITAVGNSQPTFFNPFTVTYSTLQSYSPSVFGGSMSFDGSGDFLTLPVSTALGPTTGDYTWESWLYPTVLGSNKVIYVSSQSSGGLVIGIGNSTANRLTVFRNGIAFDFIGTTDMSVYLNSWVHIAVTKLSGTTRFWINGVNTDTFTTNVTYVAGGTAASVGRRIAVSEDYTGSISNMRLVNGTALYTSNFVPSNQPLTAVQNSVLLLNGTSAAIYDASVQNNLETVGDSRLVTNITKYGNTSMFFDGTGDYLTQPSNLAVTFGTGDFTIESWIYWNSLNSESAIMWGNGVGWTLYILPANRLQWGTTSPQSGANLLTGNTTLATGQWYHIAVTRASGTVRLFVNGIVDGSVTNTSNYSAAGFLDLGRSHSNQFFNGYMSDVRITKGVARYTTNFTPSTAPLLTN